MALRLNDPLRTKIVDDGIVGYLGTSAILKVYGGTQPGTGGEATTQGIIVQIGSISWGAASNGTASISGAPSGTCGTAGTATWARLSDSSGTAYVIDGNCGTASTCDYVITAIAIDADEVVSLTAAAIVQPAS